jgi:hypothetical protein
MGYLCIINDLHGGDCYYYNQDLGMITGGMLLCFGVYCQNKQMLNINSRTDLEIWSKLSVKTF